MPFSISVPSHTLHRLGMIIHVYGACFGNGRLARGGKGNMGRQAKPEVALDPAGEEIRAIHALVDFRGKDVLEIGCGDGRLTRRFAAEARSVLGVDLNADTIVLARADLPEPLRSKVAFQVADITTIDLPTAAFDVAVLAWSL